MRLKWLGHSCFELTTNTNQTIVFDPFNEAVGYPMPRLNANIVLISHAHPDHSNLSIVQGNYSLIRRICDYTDENIHIYGVHSYHDNANGSLKGENNIFIVEADGYRICHLGDLGHTLSQEQVQKIGKLDYLMIPIGGNYTIAADDACTVIQSLNPTVVIPEHYRNDACQLNLDGVELFLTKVQNRDILQAENEIILQKSDIPQVLVMNYK